MKHRMKSNTIKLMINSFANGNLELVKQFRSQYGNEVFEYVPQVRRVYHHRLIFYAFKNGHSDIIEYYLNGESPKPLSNSEIYLIVKSTAKPGELFNFIENRSEKYKQFLPLEKAIDSIKSIITQSYDFELIDEYLDKYPEEFNSILEKCSSSNRGIQLRRHLQLKQLVNE